MERSKNKVVDITARIRRRPGVTKVCEANGVQLSVRGPDGDGLVWIDVDGEKLHAAIVLGDAEREGSLGLRLAGRSK